MLVEHLFPADGDYTINLNQSGGFGGGYIAGLDSAHQLIMTIDGVQVFDTQLGGTEGPQGRRPEAGAGGESHPRALREHPRQREGGTSQDRCHVRRALVRGVRRHARAARREWQPAARAGVFGIEIVGPNKASGVSDTPSRAKVFICHPANESEELPCAQKIVANLARRAYRRPVDDSDLAAPLRFYAKGREAHGFDGGIQQALMAILASPKFLYRVESLPANATAGTVYSISDLELASRLSFFLWSQGPDDELLSIAQTGRLREPGMLEKQVRRLLADPRSSALVTNFADQWLNVEEVDHIEPDPTLFSGVRWRVTCILQARDGVVRRQRTH